MHINNRAMLAVSSLHVSRQSTRHPPARRPAVFAPDNQAFNLAVSSGQLTTAQLQDSAFLQVRLHERLTDGLHALRAVVL